MIQTRPSLDMQLAITKAPKAVATRTSNSENNQGGGG
eukprot:CAMPEP_0175446732 /NCGR_PEP_ID=MMETSP0095-20121207/60435_1 /TAXON_ID=311494 /ORGANISM="Alexandrium monilatum, Strain CCMP3105" /LENGTH=36 /DNA_ID= /DNA_START= /DNA_END= /DNA_ORIENTATION=